MSERQYSSSLKSIHPGHIARYAFAMNRCKGSILDAACGCGYGSKMLTSCGPVVGVDLEREAIDFAKANYAGPEYRLDDVCNPQGAFDWVVSFETIEHIADPVAALKAFRASKNLVVSTPNSQKYKFNPESYKADKYPHLRHYTPEELEALLSECGWTVMDRYSQTEKISPVGDWGVGMFQVFVCR